MHNIDITINTILDVMHALVRQEMSASIISRKKDSCRTWSMQSTLLRMRLTTWGEKSVASEEASAPRCCPWLVQSCWGAYETSPSKVVYTCPSYRTVALSIYYQSVRPECTRVCNKCDVFAYNNKCTVMKYYSKGNDTRVRASMCAHAYACVHACQCARMHLCVRACCECQCTCVLVAWWLTIHVSHWYSTLMRTSTPFNVLKQLKSGAHHQNDSAHHAFWYIIRWFADICHYINPWWIFYTSDQANACKRIMRVSVCRLLRRHTIHLIL